MIRFRKKKQYKTVLATNRKKSSNEKYATEIAAQWNVKYNDDHKGYVTKFEIDDEYFPQFEVQVVGGEFSADQHN
ncbi:MAG: hypothetical protein HDR20_07230 [Lachnospiraceae bacterium]|nr:hypothetical protein [Lachnospiraceae bacterium]